jgi:hypothetical protein
MFKEVPVVNKKNIDLGKNSLDTIIKILCNNDITNSHLVQFSLSQLKNCL